MNIGILWDIENVTPPVGMHYVQMIRDSISEEGNINYAMAFGNWHEKNISEIAKELADNSFELLHIPSTGKDSSDMAMVARGVELIFQYPHIEKFVIITGDADFRPLLQSLRKYGKKTLVICDVTRNASEDLLRMADDFKDYRDIIDATDSADNNEEEIAIGKKLTKEQSFELLEDVVGVMLDEGKEPFLGAVKIRMKLLNSFFNEKQLGYRTWKAFVNDAIKTRAVQYSPEEHNKLQLVAETQKRLPKEFKELLSILNGDEWKPFTEAAKNINYKEYGYTRFKKLALDAEKRGLVILKNKGLLWYLKRG